MTVVFMAKIVVFIVAVLLVVYLLAIMPRMSHRKERKHFIGVYYAHRGLHDNETCAPENSMAAFTKAVEAGYGIELDVQLTKDHVPVVFHDFTLARICGKEGKVCDYTFQELQDFRLCGSEEKIPRFSDVLNLIDGQVPLIVELKVEWADTLVCPIADSLLREYKGLYCIESFNPLAVLWYRRNRKEVIRGQLSDGFSKTGEFKGILYFTLEYLLLNFITKPDFVAYNHKYAGNLSRKLCHRLYGNMAMAWTIKSQEELRNAIGKFDGYIFDSFIPEDF